MTADNWITIIAALATPVFAFLGIVAQCYFANKNKQGKNKQTEEITKEIRQSREEAAAARAEAAQTREEVKAVREQLSTNDVVTVSVARQEIRHMYYQLLPHKMISIVDARALNEMYEAYKAVTLPNGHHPNSWCDSLYNEMQSWEKVEVYPKHITYLNESKKKGSK